LDNLRTRPGILIYHEPKKGWFITLVRDMFRGRGACGRFKDFLASKGLLEAWYALEDEREKEALRLWCEEHGP